MPFGSLFRASQWPSLEQSLTTYYSPPPHPSQNLPPDPPKYPCRKPHRRYLTRGWSRKLYDPVIAHQREILLDLYLKEGDAAIDAFRDHCQATNGYEKKKDGMGHLERAAVDAKAVKDWGEFQRKWVEVEEKKRDEEEQRQQHQNQKHQLQSQQQIPPQTQQSAATTANQTSGIEGFEGAVDFARKLLAKTLATKPGLYNAECGQGNTEQLKSGEIAVKPQQQDEQARNEAEKATVGSAVQNAVATSKAKYGPPKVDNAKHETQSKLKPDTAKKQGGAAVGKETSFRKTVKKPRLPFIEEDSDDEPEDEEL